MPSEAFEAQQEPHTGKRLCIAGRMEGSWKQGIHSNPVPRLLLEHIGFPANGEESVPLAL